MRFISFLFVIVCSLVEGKVSIFAHYFGQPEFIKYQHLFFKKNMLDEYELVIFEDSRDPNVTAQIKHECEKYGITYVRIPPHVFDYPKLPITENWISLKAPSFQCSVATQYIYDQYVIPSQNVCLILDNDIFLLSPISIEQFLGEHAFSYVKQEKIASDSLVTYMLPNFIIFNPSLMPEKDNLNFNMGTISGVRTDSGGYTHFYLTKHRSLGNQIPIHYLWETECPLKDTFMNYCPLLFTSQEWASHYFLQPEAFLHIRMGSNWSKDPKYAQMNREFIYLFERLLQ